MRIAKAFLVSIALAAATPACGGTVGELCDAKCDCEACSDRGYETCEIETQAGIDVADVYGCADLYDELHECVIDRYRCDNSQFRVENGACDPEQTRLYQCIGDGSSASPFD
jgi:hypothetical protein